MDNVQIAKEDLAALLAQFREVKHSINNTLAVVMALSELSQRNTEYYEKLAATVLSRCPDIVDQLQGFQKSLSDKFGIQTPPPPTSH
jgi:two-component sensor histidine kinase